MAQDLPAGTLF